MKTALNSVLGALALSLSVCLAPGAVAQEGKYPSKPVTFVVPFPAGGSADSVSRALAENLSQRWSQPVVVVNRPGGGTLIGLNSIASAAPDGYTIGMNSISHVVQPAVRAKLPFHPVEGFTYISKVLEAPFVLTTNASLPVKSVPELTTYLREHPGKANYASFGVGSAGHIFFEILLQHSGVQAIHVPYKGTAEATMAQIAGDAPFMFDMIVSPMPHIKTGKLRPLMVTTSARSKQLPDVPTSKELGITDLEMPTWFGLVGPKGIAPAVLQELNAAVTAALRNPAIVEVIEKNGLTPAPSSPEEFRSFVERSINTISRAAQAAKIPKVD
ncbi:MAG: tripartite tricarboxylate transporter substrate binding protein [Burkholderiales bacterium]|nr:tripartite tricarboxylate transporter substrate binding protein [Burkholderiales bacterium]